MRQSWTQRARGRGGQLRDRYSTEAVRDEEAAGETERHWYRDAAIDVYILYLFIYIYIYRERERERETERER